MGDGLKRKPRKQTKGGSGGSDFVKRFGLDREPKERDDEVLAFYDAIKSETSRPDFDRDEFVRANNFSGEVVEIIDGIIAINNDEKLSSIMAIGEAISEGRLDEAKRLIYETERRYDHIDVINRYQILDYEGKFEEVLVLCDRGLASEPDTFVIELKAATLREMGRIREQLDLFDQWDAHFHDDPDFLAARARALVAAGRLDEAEKTALRSHELDDDLPIHVYIAMGELQLARGDPEGAIKLFNRVLDIDENEDDAYVGKANALAAMGKYEQAVLVCERFLSCAPIRGRLRRTRDRIRAAAQI